MSTIKRKDIHKRLLGLQLISSFGVLTFFIAAVYFQDPIAKTSFLFCAFIAWIVQTHFINNRIIDCFEWLLWRFGIIPRTSNKSEDFGLPYELEECARKVDQNAEIIVMRSTMQTGVLLIHEFGRRLKLLEKKISMMNDEIIKNATGFSEIEDEVKKTSTYLEHLKILVDGGSLDLIEQLDLTELLNEYIKKLTVSSSSRISMKTVANIKPEIHGVSSLVSAAFSNIIQNALKHTSGEVLIYINSPSHEDQCSLTIRIEDEGRSLSKREINNAFHFGKTTTKHTSDGNYGLGLSLANTYLKLHQGELIYKEPEDPLQNKAFEVKLPLINEIN